MAPRADLGTRGSLTRAAVLRAAVGLADRDGLEALTMRRLAQELGVEAMSLYHHVANKEAVLDGVAEVVVGEVVAAAAGTGPPAEEDWRGAVRARVLAARGVLLRHPWAPRVLATRTTMGAEVVAWYDGLLGVLRAGGFSYDLAHHALHALGSRALSFTQELFVPEDPAAGGAEATALVAALADRFPHVAGMVAEVAHGTEGALGWCDDQAEFEFGLDVLLDGLERRRAAA
ncbi:TetR/AcrR family transcriptional regulator [Geodermatophilus sp. SYSU D00758]